MQHRRQSPTEHASSRRNSFLGDWPTTSTLPGTTHEQDNAESDSMTNLLPSIITVVRSTTTTYILNHSNRAATANPDVSHVKAASQRPSSASTHRVSRICRLTSLIPLRKPCLPPSHRKHRPLRTKRPSTPPTRDTRPREKGALSPPMRHQSVYVISDIESGGGTVGN